MHSDDYVIIAVFGIVIDFIALAVFVAYPLSPADGTTVLAFYLISLLWLLTFTGLLHGTARILKIENINLFVSMFIAFTSFIIFLAVLRADFLGPYLNPYEFDIRTRNARFSDPLFSLEIYRRISLVFATIIMWITTVGIAKFMYRTKLSKAFLVSLPLPVLVMTCLVLI